ncbi:MAG: hypothetical protein ACN4GW_10695 [Desulforhopalus sp.]
MTTKTTEQNSQLLIALREGVGLIQMVLFKELRAKLANKKPHFDKQHLSMLAGSITNEIFGTQNPEEKFARFRAENRGDIEQEMLSLEEDHPALCHLVTDALRILTLCDHQEGVDSSSTLLRAKENGFLQEDRELPLPSSFMTTVRELGKAHNLIIPPVEISPEQDNSIIH